jgi:glycosyltransferase involved in cell wall biosynthesis
MRKEMKRKIVISINTAWNIFNFRAGLVRALVAAGHQVIALAPNDDYADRLKELGCEFVSLPMDNNGTHPGRDLLLLVRYYSALRALRPDVFLGYTVKPNVYGSLAAHALGIPVINNVAGLGTAFIRDNLVTKVVRGLYKMSLKRSHRVFFQNADDRALFIESGLVERASTALVPGSGLNLQDYVPQKDENTEGRSFRFLLVARMLRDKGIEEYVEAARAVKARHCNVEFQLLGFIDAGNPNGIPEHKVARWEAEGLVTYLGRTDNVRPYLSAADCVVLPSYREGVPRSLLEAAAMARPIIATDVVGCRDAVDDGVTGFLCEVKNSVSLAQKMHAMLSLPMEARAEMGAAGRRKVETEFDEQLVIQKYLGALDSIGVRAPVQVPITADSPELMPEQLNT